VAASETVTRKGYGLMLGAGGWLVYEVEGNGAVLSPMRVKQLTRNSVRTEMRKRGNPARPMPVAVHFKKNIGEELVVGETLEAAMHRIKKLIAQMQRDERLTLQADAK
jgi:hypothetical protein